MSNISTTAPCTVDTSTTAAATSQIGAATPPQRSETLRLLAAQFESMLLSQMLRDMQSDVNRSDDSGFAAPLAETIYSELAAALVKAGGMGLADSLEDAIARTTPGGEAETGLPASLPSLPALRQYSPWMPEGPVSFAIDPERVSSAYGWRKDPISGVDRMHHGVDIPMTLGEDVRTLQGGTVIESRVNGGYGHTVVVDHGEGLTTRYAHLSTRHVQVGDTVTAGQTVGLAGRTGRATGTHLHLEVRANGASIDPFGQESARLLGNSALSPEKSPEPADDVREGVRR